MNGSGQHKEGGSIPCTEAQAQKAVKQLFEAYGWTVDVMQEDVRVGSQGIPDLLCTSPHGLQLWVEMKKPASSRNPRGRVRKAQRERLTEWRRRGVACCVADGVTEELQELARDYQSSWDVDDAIDCCDDLMAEYEWWPR
jgi:hypothetical protein